MDHKVDSAGMAGEKALDAQDETTETEEVCNKRQYTRVERIQSQSVGEP